MNISLDCAIIVFLIAMLAIVGNGSCGLFTAFNLIRKGVDPSLITVIGPSNRLNAASPNAGAMTNIYAEIPYGTFEDEALKKRFDLVQPSLDAWNDFKQYMASLGRNFSYFDGTYIFTNSFTTRSERKNFDYIVNYCKSNSIGNDVIDIPSYINPLPSSDIQSCYWLPDGRFEPSEVIACLESYLLSLSVKFIDDSVSSLSPPSLLSRNKFKLSLNSGTLLESDKVLLANGSFAQNLVDQISGLKSTQPRLLYGFGCYLKLFKPDWLKTYPGLGQTLDNYDSVFRTVDRGGACGLHVVYRPQEDVFYVGASSAVSLTPQPDPSVHSSSVLTSSIVEQLNYEFYYYSLKVSGNGYRPVSSDTYPLLGETAIDNLYIYNGMKRDGFTSAPHVSALIADCILGDDKIPSIFSPNRSKIGYLNKEMAINSTLNMYKSADFQHNMRFAPYRMDATYNQLDSDIRAVYKRRNISQDFGIHPELFHLYQDDNFYNQIK